MFVNQFEIFAKLKVQLKLQNVGDSGDPDTWKPGGTGFRRIMHQEIFTICAQKKTFYNTSSDTLQCFHNLNLNIFHGLIIMKKTLIFTCITGSSSRQVYFRSIQCKTCRCETWRKMTNRVSVASMLDSVLKYTLATVSIDVWKWRTSHIVTTSHHRHPKIFTASQTEKQNEPKATKLHQHSCSQQGSDL